MDTVNISLTRSQSEYVRRKTERDFGNVSEFFRELLRQHMKQEIDLDIALLESTTKDAPAGPSETEIEEILKAQKKVRRKLRREGRV